MVDPRAEQIALVPSRYEDWRRAFAAERERLTSVLERADVLDAVERIEHVGSTAVPDLAAKDIVDLDIVVHDEAVESTSAAIADALGGTRLRNTPRWHPVFRREEGQRFNDHVFGVTSDRWKISVLTKEVLREDEALRRAYEDLKRRLAAEHDDLEAYSRAKTSFMERVLERGRERDDLVDFSL